MMNKIQYGILYIWVKLHALLPMCVLYVLSDILYLLIYYVIKYRLRVVKRNMKAAFPNKTDAELMVLERAFYHHFCDYIVETLKLAHISEEEIQQRAYITNPEFINTLIAKGHATFIVYMGHYGNWEWFSAASLRFNEVKMFQIYRPLSNNAFDRLFIKLRTRFNGFCIPKSNVVREMVVLKQQKVQALVGFLSDQTPSKSNIHYWSNFLNQDSAIYTGPERIARKLNMPAIYMDVKKIKRGYYEATFCMVAETPKETAEFELTETYIRMMETTILHNPAYWLWTHKRWKYKHEDTRQENLQEQPPA